MSLISAGTAHAQGTAVLTGTIVDAATKAPLADVVVTVTSPALQGEQTVVTDGSGSYRVPNLPQGDYTLRLDKDAFRPYARGGITMSGSSTIRVNAELLPESVQLKAEEVVVVGKAPTVDVGSSSTGIALNHDFTSRIALNAPGGKGAASHSFESLAAVAPGAQGDSYGVSINGTTSPENAFQIDGVAVNDIGFGILATPLSTEFIKELNVVSGGYMPEYGRSMGGIFDVTTNTGSNEFHGSVWFNLSPGGLEGPPTKVLSDKSTITTTPHLGNLRDFGASVGGPIIKDKLWFYAGLQSAFSRQVLDRSLSQFDLDADGNKIPDPATGFSKVTPIPGGARTYYADEQAIQYIGKLTYLLSQDHHLTLSVIGTPTTSGGNGTFGIDNRGLPEVTNVIGTYGAIAHKYVANASDVSLKYQGSFNNKKQLLDLTLGWHHQRSATLAPDGSNIGDRTGLASVPGVIYRRSDVGPSTTKSDLHSIADFESVPSSSCRPVKTPIDNPDYDPTLPVSASNPKQILKPVTPCPVDLYYAGGPGFLDDASINSYQARAVFTNLVQAAGHHVIKAGVDANLSSYEHVKAYSGTNFFRENGSGSNYNDYRQYGYLQGPDNALILTSYTAKSTSTTVGGFVQDSWAILDKITLNVGLRYDTQLIYGSDGALGLSLPNQWSPRIGIIYDFTQQGRSKIFANFARYYEGVPLDIADRGFPGEPEINSRHHASQCNPALTASDPNFATMGPSSPGCTGDANRYVGTAAFGNTTYNPNQIWNRTGGDKVPIDPDVSAQSSDEFVVGGEYEVFADARLGMTYTHRYLNRAIEDMSRDEANTYFIGNPGYGISSDFPKAVRNYDAVTVYFNKTFSNNWLATMSYTASSLRGNYAGLFRPETNQLDPNANSDFDLKSLLPNRTGPLPGDYTHQIKIYAAKDFIIPGGMDLLFGGTFRSRSGSPVSYLGSHPIYGPDEVFILPRGAGGRNDWIHNVDLRVGYSIRLSQQSTASITMDIFNLFNFQGVTFRDQTYTNSDVLPIVNKDGTNPTPTDVNNPAKFRNADGTAFDPAKERNPNFSKPTQYQDPRQFRFGAKVTF